MSRQDTSPSKLSLNPPDANVMVRFVGELNGNLKFIEKKLNVQIFQNGNNLSIQGDGSNVEKAYAALQKLYTEAGKGLEITQEILHLCLQEDQPDDTSQIKTPRKVIKPRTKNQRAYLENMNKYEINFGIGPAGTGKTYLAMAQAIDYLLNKKVEKKVTS